MRQISSTARSISFSETPGQTGDIAAAFAGEGYKGIIDKANSISLLKLFKLYNVRLDESNRKTTCPFKSHKGGRESTASFYYYPQTNTYHCYGCRQGNTPVDFVINMDNCSLTSATNKIIDHFNSDLDENFSYEKEDFEEKMNIMMLYSNEVRNFKINFTDEKSFNFIEENCKIFDKINEKYDLNVESLNSVVYQLIDNIKKYKP